MKKTVFTLLMVIAGITSFAQIYKGQFMVGGNGTLTSSKYNGSDESTTLIQFNPNVGYFFINNFAGGLRLNLSSIKEENDDAFTEFAVSPFLRYYFLPATNKTNIFADVSYGVGSTGSNDKESFNQFSIMAGPAIFLTPNVALEFALGYTSQGGDAIGDERFNTFGLIMAGFQIHLGRQSASR
jgi:hypothetical protein